MDEHAKEAARTYAAEAAKIAGQAPGLGTSVARPVDRVGVIGGGTMGAGIAVALLDAGLQVIMVERDQPSLDAGRQRVQNVYDRLRAKERLTAAQVTERMDAFQGATDYAALAQTDLAIEAVFEDMAVKKTVFEQLDATLPAGAVLATNTSYLDIDQIAQATKRPQDVLGLHFFSPANIMPLLEIVVAAQTSPETLATGFALAQRMNKTAVRAGVCDGFIGNRIFAAYRLAADMMMEDGASPYEIDEAVRALGYPMGPYQVADLAGGDIGWATRKRRAATRDPLDRYVQIPDRLCEAGWFGQKTGRGFYLYPDGARTGTPDPEVLAIVQAERERAGITPRHFTKEDIQRRYMAAMINEAANVLHEGIALRPSDVDAVAVAGYGFPKDLGGPLYYADQVGLDRILSDIRAFAPEAPRYWQASPLIVDLFGRGEKMDSLNRKAPASL